MRIPIRTLRFVGKVCRPLMLVEGGAFSDVDRPISEEMMTRPITAMMLSVFALTFHNQFFNSKETCSC